MQFLKAIGAKSKNGFINSQLIFQSINQFKMEQLTIDICRLIEEIPHITNVDFIPSTKEEYETLPEPYRTEALELLEYRNENWDDLCEGTKKKYE